MALWKVKNAGFIFLMTFMVGSMSSQDIGIGTSNPSEKLDVNGRISAKGYKFTIHEVGGLNLQSVSLSSIDVWQDFPDLSITFSLDTTTTVMADYSISGPLNNSYLITKLIIDSIDPNETGVAHSIQGNGTYGTNSGQYVTELGPGNHTIKVKYRTPAFITYSSGTDWQNRSLQVLVFGVNE